MGDIHSFRDDKLLSPILKTIPQKEKSTIIRMALRDYFKLTDSKNGQIGYKEDEHEQKRDHQ